MIATGSTQRCQCRGLPMSPVVPRPALSERQERQGADADVHACSWHFDFTHPLAYMAHTVTNVPMPGCSKAKPPMLPAKSGTATSKADSSKRAVEVKKETKKGR